MSSNNNNKVSVSGSASGSAKGVSVSAKGSQKESRSNSPSKFSNNPFAPLFVPESTVYNKTSPGPSIFTNKKFVRKALSSHPLGADSSGPMGQFTTKRADFVAAWTASFVPNTPLPKVARKISPPAVRPKRPYHSVSWLEAEAHSRLLKANINEMYAPRELMQEAINQMTNLRR